MERQLDFSDAGKAVARFLANRNRRLFSMSTENALVTLLREGVSVQESSVDSKRDLEDALRSACNDFIEHTCKRVAGDFMAFVPGTRRQQNWPSTVAYIARLIIHRYAMLGILDEHGYPTREMGILESPRNTEDAKAMQGARCNECGNYTVIKKDGCEFCTACGAVGSCG